MHITLHNLIRVNLSALDRSLLPAGPRFITNGIPCSIGLCLTPGQLNQILARNLNEASIYGIAEAKIASFEDEDLFRFTQLLHDAWATGIHIQNLSGWLPHLPASVREFVKSLTKIDAATFRTWFHLLAQEQAYDPYDIHERAG